MVKIQVARIHCCMIRFVFVVFVSVVVSVAVDVVPNNIHPFQSERQQRSNDEREHVSNVNVHGLEEYLNHKSQGDDIFHQKQYMHP